MDEDEAALLAELRAISNKTSAASRFDGENDDNNDADGAQQPPPPPPPPSAPRRLSLRSNTPPPPASPGVASVSSHHSTSSSTTSASHRRLLTPPWRRSKKNKGDSSSNSSSHYDNDADAAVKVPNLGTTTTENSAGAAEDAAPKRTGSWSLPPFGRRRSSSSKSKKEKSDDSDADNDRIVEARKQHGDLLESASSSDEAAATEISKKGFGGSTPPWKRKKGGSVNNKQSAVEPAAEVLVVAAAAPTMKTPPPPQPKDDDKDKKDDEPKSNSYSTDRLFANASSSSRQPPSQQPGTNSPSKKKQQQQQPADTTESAADHGGGIQSDMPKAKSKSTFTGERGGAAEDAELLALLRSVKSGAADRFATIADSDDYEENENTGTDDIDIIMEQQQPAAAPLSDKEVAKSPTTRSSKQRAGTPPWKKRAGPKQQASAASASNTSDNIDVVVVAAPPPPKEAPTSSSNSDEAPAAQKHEQPAASAAAAPVVESSSSSSMGIKSDIPSSTFSGERGGAAEDAELLALLRGVSNKSGAADRFAGSENDDNDGEDQAGSGTNEPAAQADVAVQAPAPAPNKPAAASSKSNNKRSGTPPWKKRGPNKQSQPAASASSDIIDIVVAAAPPQPKTTTPVKDDTQAVVAPQQSVESTMGIKSDIHQSTFKSDIPSTFSGERGGAAEDPELLALLRGVSTKSGAADRFANDNDGDAVNENENQNEPTPHPNEVVAAAPAPPPTKPDKRRSGTPPWKRKGPKQAAAAKSQENDQVDVVVAAPPRAAAVTAPATVAAVAAKEESAGFGIKSDLPSTFQGERGGTAEDEELLAELRAISSKSSSMDRFAVGDDEDGDGNGDQAREVQSAQAVTAPAPSAPAAKSKRAVTPPWKRKGKNKPTPMATNTNDVAVVIAAPQHPPPPTNDQPAAAVEEESSGYGIKSDIPSTFSGERGGSAEDAELLALLRGVSSGADRFADDEEDPSNINAGVDQKEAAKEIVSPPRHADPPAQRASEKLSSPHPDPPALRASEKLSPSKPWQGKNAAKQSGDEVDAVVAAPRPAPATRPAASEENSSGFGIKSDMPSTFNGERGGAAENAELLALLRGVSSKSGGGSRFNEETNADVNKTDAHQETSRSLGTPNKQQLRSSFDEKSMVASSPPAAQPDDGAPEEEQITLEDLPEALTSKVWKQRAQAYVLLKTVLAEQTQGKDPSGDVDADSVLEGLDDLVRTMPQESNAMALDKALEFLNLYASHCRRAGDAEQAAAIISAVVAKNALSSRPSTLKLATALTLTLMEVGSEGNSSVAAVVDVLITKGLTSRKPKVVHASASIILSAAQEFGAVNLPLASVVSCSPKMLSHANAQVRTIGLKILAEFCRVLGSRDPLQEAMDSMKKAQMSELDAMLAKQPNSESPRRKLRSQLHGDNSSSPSSQADAKELEAQLFAARPAVKLMEVLPKTEYKNKIALQKWSEKVAALKIVLDAGGQKPYKLEQPSPSANYGPLIIEMKKLLSHTHFAVCSKAMEVLSMLAEGVGEKLFSHLRPLLPTLLALSKDKKLTKAVASCLDSFFGNVLAFDHLLDREDALPTALEERKQKNALARASALAFLERCVRRRDSAGRRGVLSPTSASAVADLCTNKLDDSDASVRKATMGVFRALQAVGDEECSDVVSAKIEALKASHTRAHKTLTKANADTGSPTKSPANGKIENRRDVPQPLTNTTAPSRDARSHPASKPPARSRATAANNKNNISVDDKADRLDQNHSTNFYTPILEEALSHVCSMRIPQWDAPEDDGGILTGLHSSAWIKRQDAIKSITAFVESGRLGGETKDVCTNSSSILVVVREHTRGFKETNVNIMRSILLLFVALCDYHEAAECEFMDWARQNATSIAVSKLSDRKLSDICKGLLLSLCSTCPPGDVLLEGSEALKTLKSPVIHEEYLKWFRVFCAEFGAVSIGSSISEIIPWLLDETVALNPKVKREALSTAGLLHRQLGPGFKALTLSMAKDPASREQLEKCFNSNPFDPSLESQDWPRQSIAVSAVGRNGNESPGGGLVLEVPKLDLIAELSDDCVVRMGSKDGKTAWKQRKEAIDEVDQKLKDCSGLVDTSPPKFKALVDLMRGLRDRLSDTQINLKPLAARVIGVFLGHVDKASQARLGKVVFGPLINAAMNDIKKPMREASIVALRQGTTASSLDGGDPNPEAMETFLISFVGEVNETAVRSGGLSDVLLFVLSLVEYLPSLDDIAASRGQSLGDNYAAVVVECLTSSKSETRSAATSLLETSVRNNVVSLSSIRKTTEKMKPAKQRTVGAIVAKFSQSLPATSSGTTEPAEGPRRPLRTSSLSSSGPGPRPSARDRPALGRQNGAALKATNQPSQDNVNVAPTSRHPLVSRTNRRIPSKPIAWPEFPEEPIGLAIFGSLKKLWAPMLPGPSLAILFPASGIKKQDDAKEACELLSRAIDADRSSSDSEVELQLDCILKWIVYVLCCREATVGLQALIALIKKLFQFLCEIRRPLTDSDVMMLAPFLLEKASNAKGRFRESLMELVSMMQSEELIPAKRLGLAACIPVLERSNHAKARALACHICVECVRIAALPSVGKKGVLVAAKALSTESIPENKSAALDLMEAILAKMQGDIPRLVKICGTNLSDKAREDVEARWLKNEGKHLSEVASSTPRSNATPAPQRGHVVPTPTSQLQDELPALALREAAMEHDKASSKPRIVETDMQVNIEDPFAFAQAARKATSPASSSGSQITGNDGFQAAKMPMPGGTASTSIEAEGLATAASLRARLLKIREKSKAPVEAESKEGRTVQSTSTASNSIGDSSDGDFHEGVELLGRLIAKEPLVPEDDTDLLVGIDVMKQFHSALSQPSNVPKSELRRAIEMNLSLIIENITNLLDFAFNCVDAPGSSGMSIPLLSVCLATLMALLREPELPTNISQDDLMLLLRATTTALLDSRLSSNSELDDATSSQMVRAINKAAVCVSTCSARHTSLQALMTLQQQLTLEVPVNIEQETFNSRLSRVVCKLFARVIKAEEAAACPFSTAQVDMEALICCMEDALVALRASGRSIESDDACTDMIRTLVRSIIESYEGTQALVVQVDELGIDPRSSCLGALISSCMDEDPVEDEVSGNTPPEPSSAAVVTNDLVLGPSVASLVSALGSSKEGPERQAALEALRTYKMDHGDTELNAHLQELSPAFRDFIEEQLHGGEPSPEKASSDIGANNVSERLKNLRSRLQQASELTVPPPNEDASKEALPASPTVKPSVSSPSKSSPALRATRLPRPTPSRLQQPTKSSASSSLSAARHDPRGSPSKVSQPTTLSTAMDTAAAAAIVTTSMKPSTLQNLNERLSAATTDNSTLPASAQAGASAGNTGRAALLRARLEAVKQQNKQEFDA